MSPPLLSITAATPPRPASLRSPGPRCADAAAASDAGYARSSARPPARAGSSAWPPQVAAPSRHRRPYPLHSRRHLIVAGSRPRPRCRPPLPRAPDVCRRRPPFFDLACLRLCL
ncbi:hypothetical protein BS78_03G246200 [Paspalum vaginatum]|nr:hypothetical protein BS78_03G246200 [Paspalum vaginatum]